MSALVSGYDSDSDSDGAHSPSCPIAAAGPSKASAASKPGGGSGLSSLLPAPKKASGGGLNSLLPPPKSSAAPSLPAATAQPKKRQIKIDALSSLGSSSSTASDEAADEPEAKRPKLTAAPSGGKLSLFSMLPAPSAKPEAATASPALVAGGKEEKGGRGSVAVSASQRGIDASGEGDDEDGEEHHERPKTKPTASKGNNDFRAMLGLKPAAAASASGRPKQKAVIPVISSSSAANGHGKGAAPTSLNGAPNAKVAAREDAEEAASGQSGMDFFSLATSTSRATSSSAAPSTSLSISSAPLVDEARAAEEEEEGEDPYKGWQQDPDGSWVPITPEAHEAYNKWAKEEALRAAQAGAESGRGGGGGFDPSELEGKSIEDFDAGRSVREGQVVEAGTATGARDAKYAKAASETASEAGAAASTAPANEKKKDKMTGFRARQKGQLTSLLAMAEEKRETLEQKWAAGKGKANESRMRYGF